MKRARAEREADPVAIILGALWVLGLFAVFFAAMMMDGGTSFGKVALTAACGLAAMIAATAGLRRI